MGPGPRLLAWGCRQRCRRGYRRGCRRSAGSCRISGGAAVVSRVKWLRSDVQYERPFVELCSQPRRGFPQPHVSKTRSPGVALCKILICVTEKLSRDLAVSGKDSGHVSGEVFALAIIFLLRLANENCLCLQIRHRMPLMFRSPRAASCELSYIWLHRLGATAWFECYDLTVVCSRIYII